MAPRAALPVELSFELPVEPLAAGSGGLATGFVEAACQVRQTTLAIERTIPVASALADLLPDGLRRGSIVGVSGAGGRSLAMALVSAATAAGSWIAVVGDPDFCLVAGSEAGLDLRRLVVVGTPPSTLWAEVVGVLVGALDLVMISPAHWVSATVSRRLASRCRERGSVLIWVGGDPWPDRCDLRLTVLTGTWSGLADGYGRLQSRWVEVAADGRGAMAGSRRSELLLPGPDGTASVVG